MLSASNSPRFFGRLSGRNAIKNICGNDCGVVYVPGNRLMTHTDMRGYGQPYVRNNSTYFGQHFSTNSPWTFANWDCNYICTYCELTKSKCHAPHPLENTATFVNGQISSPGSAWVFYFCSASIIVIIILLLITPDIHDFSVGDFLLLPRRLCVYQIEYFTNSF